MCSSNTGCQNEVLSTIICACYTISTYNWTAIPLCEPHPYDNWPCKVNIWAASWQNQCNAFATSMDSDQPAHPRSLIRIHTVRLQTLFQVEKLIENSMDPDQTARIRRLIWIHAGRKPTVLVLSWRGSITMCICLQVIVIWELTYLCILDFLRCHQPFQTLWVQTTMG
jgi:hypothetical protein